MVVWGGDSGGYSFKNTGGVYDPGTDTWVRATTTTNAPPARANHAAIWTGTRMLIWGGEDPARFNTGAFYDPGADAWTGTTTTMGAPAGRSHLNGVWTGDEMIIWGGGEGTLPGNPLNTGARYNPLTDSWTGSTTLVGAPEARSSHAMVWTGNQMIVWGGTSASQLLDTGGLYRPPATAQTQMATITLSIAGGYTPTQQISVSLTVLP